MEQLSIGTGLAWHIAVGEAANARYQYAELEHFLIGICSLEKALHPGAGLDLDHDAAEALRREVRMVDEVFSAFELQPSTIRRRLRRRLGDGGYEGDRQVIHRSDAARAVFERAIARAAERGESPVMSIHLLAAVIEQPGATIAELLDDLRVDAATLRAAAEQTLDGPRQPKPVAVQQPGWDGATGTSTTPYLDRYGLALTRRAAAGELAPLIGRRRELLEIVRILGLRTKNNPVLIGEAGVGKTAIVEGLAQRIVTGKDLPERRIVELRLNDLVAGTRYRGELEERLQHVVEEARAHPEVILFIDEIHTLVGAGNAEGGLDAGNVLKPALARGEIACIGATTTAEYRKRIEADPALERRFRPVLIGEPSPEETLTILEGLRSVIEGHHQVAIAPSALEAAVDLSVRYVPDRQLPDKAIDAIELACRRVRVPNLSMADGLAAPGPASGGLVTAEAVAEVIAEWTGIPVGRLTEQETDRLRRLEAHLVEHVVGQEEAVRRVAARIRRARAGLADSNRPTGVFLFLGPTGVGKTALAKALAEVLFGSEDDLIRLDMSEYQEPHSVAKLIGAPPGYVGYEEAGQLTGKLRTKPYSVVLLDEIEKAHPRILDVFLQLFDEGRLTDSKGRTIPGKHAIYIMTSNITPDKRLGFDAQGPDSPAEAPTSLLRHFRPELIGRIDEQIVFRRLTVEHVKTIVAQRLVRVARLLREQPRQVSLSWSDDALTWLARTGMSDTGGVRDVNRHVERQVEEPLSEQLLAGHLMTGALVTIELAGDQLTLVASFATS